MTNETDRPFAVNLNGCGERVHVSGTFHVFRQHYQFTVNANGEVTVDFNDIESICS